MSKLYVKFDDEGNLYVDDVFWEKYFEYAKEHNFNVVYTQTHSQDFVECLKSFREAGYKDILFEVPAIHNGLELKPYLYCKFERSVTE